MTIKRYYSTKKLHNLYVVKYTVYTCGGGVFRNRFYKNIGDYIRIRNIIKKVLEDNGYYYFGTTSYIKYDFKSYNIDYRILSYLEKQHLLKSIKRELLNRKLPIYYMNNIELKVAV